LKNNRHQPRHLAAAPPVREWINPQYLSEACSVSLSELEEALARARADLLRGKKPLAAGVVPHLIVTIGGPGSGKSTVAEAVAKKWGNGGDYVTIDLDTAVQYHPRFAGLWGAPSVVTGQHLGVGLTTAFFSCNLSLERVLDQIYDELLYSGQARRYNLILQSHSHTSLVEAKLAGYRTTLLFVGAPLQLALQRCRARAVETGMFLAPTLSLQDEIVYSMWATYRAMAVWYGMWADEFLVADNSSPGRDAAQVAKLVKGYPLHGSSGKWEGLVGAAQRAVDEVCGVSAEVSASLSSPA
jgi:dephospho-CoA kinase